MRRTWAILPARLDVLTSSDSMGRRSSILSGPPASVNKNMDEKRPGQLCPNAWVSLGNGPGCLFVYFFDSAAMIWVTISFVFFSPVFFPFQMEQRAGAKREQSG